MELYRTLSCLCGSRLLNRTEPQLHACDSRPSRPPTFLPAPNSLGLDGADADAADVERATGGRAPLTGERLERLPVATVSWGDWRAAHPDGLVLSRETGHDRRYGENPSGANPAARC
ncbi:MAG: DUF3179 domain-containing (seleno)protein [Acidimicrobiales bacterium]